LERAGQCAAGKGSGGAHLQHSGQQLGAGGLGALHHNCLEEDIDRVGSPCLDYHVLQLPCACQLGIPRSAQAGAGQATGV